MNVDECNVGFDQGYFGGTMQLCNKDLLYFDRISFQRHPTQLVVMKL